MATSSKLKNSFIVCAALFTVVNCIKSGLKAKLQVQDSRLQSSKYFIWGNELTVGESVFMEPDFFNYNNSYFENFYRIGYDPIVPAPVYVETTYPHQKDRSFGFIDQVELAYSSYESQSKYFTINAKGTESYLCIIPDFQNNKRSVQWLTSFQITNFKYCSFKFEKQSGISGRIIYADEEDLLLLFVTFVKMDEFGNRKFQEGMIQVCSLSQAEGVPPCPNDSVSPYQSRIGQSVTSTNFHFINSQFPSSGEKFDHSIRMDDHTGFYSNGRVPEERDVKNFYDVMTKTMCNDIPEDFSWNSLYRAIRSSSIQALTLDQLPENLKRTITSDMSSAKVEGMKDQIDSLRSIEDLPEHLQEKIETMIAKAKYDGYIQGKEEYEQKARQDQVCSELIVNAKAEGKELGYQEGLAKGESQGFDKGMQKGLLEGLNQGSSEGQNRGFEKGKLAGYEEGKADGIKLGREQGFKDGKLKGYTEGRNDGFKQGKSGGEMELGDGFFYPKRLTEDERAIFRQGYSQGHQDGFYDGKEEGIKEGTEDGFYKGYAEGEKNGYKKGEKIGNDVGFEKGFNEGRKHGYGDGKSVGFDLGVNECLKNNENQFFLNGYKVGFDAGLLECPKCSTPIYRPSSESSESECSSSSESTITISSESECSTDLGRR